MLDFSRTGSIAVHVDDPCWLVPGAVLAPACFLSVAGESLFPVTPVKKAARTHLDRIKIVEAAGVDAEILRIGAGNVEGMDAAMAAEGMLRDAGIEAIGGEIVTAAQQLELPGRDANPDFSQRLRT